MSQNKSKKTISTVTCPTPEGKISYALFKRMPRPKEAMIGFWFNIPLSCDEGEEYKKDTDEKEKRPEEILEFVCEVNKPADVAKAVREAPLERYILFKGQLMEINVAIPVFVNGKNLETLDKEWDVT